jgi:hypothetical protein
MEAVLVISALIAREVVRWVLAPSPSNVASQIEEGFKQATAQIKATVPRKIDAGTTLTDVSYSGAVLTYYYQLDTDNYDLQPNFLVVVKKNTTEQVCNTAAMKETIQLGGVYRYSYSDAHAKSLGTFDVKGTDCG